MSSETKKSPVVEPSAHWSVAAGEGLVWRQWDRAAVLHHLASGETHYLNLLSVVALELLEKEYLSLDELTAKMAVYMDVDQDATIALQAEALVRKFDELGLIEPCRLPA